MSKTWGDIYNRHLAKGHDHGSAAEKADAWERRVATNALACTSTHCERRQECASPSDCSGDFDAPDPGTERTEIPSQPQGANEQSP